MAIRFSRNVVIPIWFAFFALVTFFAPPSDFFASVLMLIVALAVPALTYVLWHDPPQPVGVLPAAIETTRKRPLADSA